MSHDLRLVRGAHGARGGRGGTAGRRCARLALRPQRELRGRLHDVASRPVRGARVRVWIVGGTYHWELRTDSTGRFTTRAMPEGEYRVELVARDGRPLAEPQDLGTIHSGDQEADLRVPL